MIYWNNIDPEIVEQIKKAIAPKEFLFAYNSSASTYVRGDLIKFEAVTQGNISRTNTTFSLKKGKIYRISFSGIFELNDWVGVALYDVTNNKIATEHSFTQYFNASTANLSMSDHGLFECIISPLADKNFGITVASMGTGMTSVVLRDKTAHVMVTEI